MRILLFAAFLSACAAPPPPEKSVTTPEPRPATVTTIDPATGISETVYGNGLTLLVAPQPGNPVASCQIWYRVGARDEDRGETGLSHFLEHMLFKGTDRYKKGDIDKVTQRNGGTNNASTWNDLTEYHFTFPADRWETALEIESNRMRNSSFLPDEFDAERKVVLEELKIGKDDPENVLWEQVESAAFPVSGYHHPVIGWEEEVTNVPRETVKAYYLRHYTPDRATIVVAGGVDRDRAIARVGELFQAIPRGDVKRRELREPLPLGEKRLSLLQDTEVPRLLVVFRSMSVSDPREPRLDLLKNILAEGKSSRLEKGLVETGIAATIDVSNDSRRDDGLFTILVEPAPGKTLDEAEAALFALLDGFDPTQKELDRARAQILAEIVFARESAAQYGMRLGQMSAMATWRYVLTYPEALRKATPEELKELAREVFRRDRVVIGRSIPKEDGEGAGGGEGEPRRRGRAKADGAATVAAALELKPTRAVLDNGLTVIVLERKSNPVFTAQLHVRDGRLGEAAPGLHAFASALLEEGTKLHSADEIADTIGAVGGTLSASADGVAVRVLSKDAALGLGFLAEVAREPAFAPESIERVRAQQGAAIKEELDTPRAVAQAKFQEAIYGAGHPLGRSANGTEASVKAITRDQIAAHHAAFFVPSNAILAIVTDLPADDALKLAQGAFGSWPKAAPPSPAPP
ncbi:MAG: M16 family metallopeptidase, partial [Planctomycetota bacterium]